MVVGACGWLWVVVGLVCVCVCACVCGDSRACRDVVVLCGGVWGVACASVP